VISICRDHAGNVKRWRDGTMALRWCAAGMVEAGKQFRRVNGHPHLPALRGAEPACRNRKSQPELLQRTRCLKMGRRPSFTGLGTSSGVVVASVPWARHDAGHTYAFDETVTWLATQSSKSTVCELMRIAWRTVGSIITRVWADVEAQHDRLAGLPADRHR